MRRGKFEARGGHAAQSVTAKPKRAASSQKPPVAANRRYIASVDGLRAFAVIAVILYHLNVPFAQGGLLGVTVFFVISGYLITGLLTAEWEETGGIKLLQFWLRRIRRLFPAIVVVIVVMAALYALLSPVLLTKMRPDIIPGLFWFENWWYIVRGVSYFDAIGAPSPLTHFWSLAIEEQFYLVWPILLLGAFKLGAKNKIVRRACLVLAVISALGMALLYDPAGDPSRVYYGTDTRAFSLLIGAWLSFVWPGVQLTEESTRDVSPSAVRNLDIAGVVAFAGIVAMCVFISGMSWFMYRGGLLLCSILTAVVIAALVHPRSQLARVAGMKPFVWVGLRSYGMYLWHFPLILLLAELFHVHGVYPWWFDLLVIVLVFAVSAASYTFIENPIRHGALGKWVRAVKAGEISPADFFRGHVLQTAAATIVCAVAVGGCALVPDTYLVPKDEIKSTGESINEAMQIAKDQPPEFKGHSPLLIGDSVPGNAQTEYYSAFPKGFEDCVIGRYPSQAAEVLEGYVDQGVVGKVVVVASFSNGVAGQEDLEAMLAAAGPDRQLYLVNTYNTDGFMEEQNALLSSFADAHENVHVIDWAGLVAPHADTWLYPDGSHMEKSAYQLYFGNILDAVRGDLKPEECGSVYSEFPPPEDYDGEVASVSPAPAQ